MHGRAYVDSRACMCIIWPCTSRALGRTSGETQAHGRAMRAHGRASGSSTKHRSENAQNGQPKHIQLQSHFNINSQHFKHHHSSFTCNMHHQSWNLPWKHLLSLSKAIHTHMHASRVEICHPNQHARPYKHSKHLSTCN